MSAGAINDAPSWPSYALPRGTSINGYRIERVLGSGGFGVTYLAYDLLQQRFAIKEYFPRQFAHRHGLAVVAASAEDEPLFDECRDRFLREAKALVVLSRVADSRGSIVRVQTYFEAHGTCFLVMDYVEGASLANVLREEPSGLPATRVASLLSQLLSSIRIVHGAGLMHRDIKPANIIMGDGDKVVLIDFGSSRETAHTDTLAYTQIYSGGYAPPEQILGLPQGKFSDIYAIGAVCYRAIGGKVVNAVARQNALAAGQPDPQPSAGHIGAGRYPRELLAVIDRALALDPMLRPQSVETMLAALEPDPALEAPTVVVRKPTVSAPRQSRGWGIPAACGAVAIVGAAAGFLFLHGSSTPPAGTHQEAASPPAPVTEAPTPAPQAAIAPPPQATDQPAPSPPTEQPQREAITAPAPAPSPPPEQPQREAITAPPLAPSPLAEQPQHDAIPAPPPTPSPPAAQPQHEAISAPPPTPSPPAEQPQREAIVLPPPAPPPAPTPPSPLERAQAAALTVPCSVLDVGTEQDRIRVSGLARTGPELDRLLADLRGAGGLEGNIARVDHAACAPVTTMATLVRQSWASTPHPIALRPAQREVSSGSRSAVDIDTALPVLYVDLYQADGSVRHLLRPTQTRSGNRTHFEWTATPPAGDRLMVAIGSARPLDPGTRPEAEKTADYLQFLQPRLQNAAWPIAADLVIVTVHAVEPAVIKLPQRRPVPVRSERCANILSRAQLGETLSDAEVAALRTECRS